MAKDDKRRRNVAIAQELAWTDPKSPSPTVGAVLFVRHFGRVARVGFRKATSAKTAGYAMFAARQEERLSDQSVVGDQSR